MILALLLALAFQTQAAPSVTDEPLTPPIVHYPVDARNARIQGTVVLRVEVDPTGRVTHVEALEGPVALRQAAIDAYTTANYHPLMKNGRPTPAVITTSVKFNLNELPPDTDQLRDAQFQPLQATCEQQVQSKAPEALDTCHQALDMASHFSAGFELEAHATAFNDVVLLLIADGKKSTHLPEAEILATQAIDLTSQVASNSPHRPAVAIAYITRCEVRSLAGNLSGASSDCAQAEETLTTVLHDYPENDRSANYRVQLRETLQLHAIIAERDHHPLDARRLRNRAASI